MDNKLKRLYLALKKRGAYIIKIVPLKGLFFDIADTPIPLTNDPDSLDSEILLFVSLDSEIVLSVAMNSEIKLNLI